MGSSWIPGDRTYIPALAGKLLPLTHQGSPDGGFDIGLGLEEGLELLHGDGSNANGGLRRYKGGPPAPHLSPSLPLPIHR